MSITEDDKTDAKLVLKYEWNIVTVIWKLVMQRA